MAGDHHHFRGFAAAAYVMQRFKAAEFGQEYVKENQTYLCSVQNFHADNGILGGEYLIFFIFKDRGKRLTDSRFVINNQYRRHVKPPR